MADIKVNASDWNKLDEQHRSEIASILKKSGLLSGEDKIVADDAAPKAKAGVEAAASHLRGVARSQRPGVGEARAAGGFKVPSFVCDIAEAAAVAACALVPTPGNAVCVAAAHAAAELCRQKNK